MGYFLDGRVSAVWGTHTHVPTMDSAVFSGGTAFRCDIGMTGLEDSVIGANKRAIIQQFLTQMGYPDMHDVEERGTVALNAQLLEIEGSSVKRWEPIQETVTI